MPNGNEPRKHTIAVLVENKFGVLSRVAGLYPQDTWSGSEVTYTRLSCAGGSLAAEVQSDPALFSKPQTVAAFRELILAPGPATIRIPARTPLETPLPARSPALLPNCVRP